MSLGSPVPCALWRGRWQDACLQESSHGACLFQPTLKFIIFILFSAVLEINCYVGLRYVLSGLRYAA